MEGINTDRNNKSKLEKASSSLSSSASNFTKVAAMSAGLLIGGNNLEANNLGQNNNLISSIENTSNIEEDEKNKTLKGGNIDEVVVYGKKKYEEELTKQEENIKKFEAEMAKYQKDSVEWAVVNKGYQDSLRLYKGSIDAYNNKLEVWAKEYNKKYPEMKLTKNDFTQLNHILSNINSLHKYPIIPSAKDLLSHDNEAYYTDVTKDNNLPESVDTFTGKNIINGEKIRPQYLISDGEGSSLGIYKKPSTKYLPLNPIKPTNEFSTIKYDPKFEDLNMRSLWPTILKQDPSAKIGTLHALDPQFEKGFTLEEAMTFPQEIKDEYNIDYIYNQIHGSDKKEDYKHPGWEYNNPTK